MKEARANKDAQPELVCIRRRCKTWFSDLFRAGSAGSLSRMHGAYGMPVALQFGNVTPGAHAHASALLLTLSC